jgi:broad specificity phosphatase PhoE
MAPRCVKLMIIRHAEKPDTQANVAGVSEGGAADKNDLTVKGWRRAGALVRLFNPLPQTVLRPGLAVPGAIFAAPATDDNPSKRPLHTVAPLASDLKLDVRTQFALHQEKPLVAVALDAAATVLISWHHERIPKLAAELGVAIDPWPDTVFDRVLVFDRVGDGWKLSVTSQRLLPGDS